MGSAVLGILLSPTVLPYRVSLSLRLLNLVLEILKFHQMHPTVQFRYGFVCFLLVMANSVQAKHLGLTWGQISLSAEWGAISRTIHQDLNGFISEIIIIFWKGNHLWLIGRRAAGSFDQHLDKGVSCSLFIAITELITKVVGSNFNISLAF